MTARNTLLGWCLYRQQNAGGFDSPEEFATLLDELESRLDDVLYDELSRDYPTTFP